MYIMLLTNLGKDSKQQTSNVPMFIALYSHRGLLEVCSRDTYGTKGYQLVKMVDINMYKNPKQTGQYLLDYLLIIFGERYTYKKCETKIKLEMT